MTFALGLSSVWFISGSKNGLIEVLLNLPQTESGEVIVVFPKNSSEVWCCMGAGGGNGYLLEDRQRYRTAHLKKLSNKDLHSLSVNERTK